MSQFYQSPDLMAFAILTKIDRKIETLISARLGPQLHGHVGLIPNHTSVLEEPLNIKSPFQFAYQQHSPLIS